MIKIFIVRLLDQEKEIINSLLQSTEYKIFSIPQADVTKNISKGDFLIGIGIQSCLMINQTIKSLNLIDQVYFLEISREEINQESIKEKIDSFIAIHQEKQSPIVQKEIIISKDAVVSAKVANTVLAEIDIEDTQKRFFTKVDNQVIEIVEKETDLKNTNSLTNIVLTVEELKTVKLIVDLLKVENVTLKRK